MDTMWHPDIPVLLKQLVADVKRRDAKPGDMAYDTMVTAYLELTDSEPNYRYIRNILFRALNERHAQPDCPGTVGRNEGQASRA